MSGLDADLPVDEHGRLELVLRLLDHQLVGSSGELLGNVDDLVLEAGPAGLAVTGLLSGPPAMARRQGGAGGRWIDAIWRRLHPLEDPPVEAVRWSSVDRVDSAVHLDEDATEFVAAADLTERWLREHVVSRLPGARGHDEADPGADSPQKDGWVGPAFALGTGAPTLSGLLGADVRGEAGQEFGEVIEVLAVPADGSALRVTAFVCSHRHLGQELGYTTTPQGPNALRLLLRAWHRDDRHVAVEDVVDIDWSGGQLTVRDGARMLHPHEVQPRCDR